MATAPTQQPERELATTVSSLGAETSNTVNLTAEGVKPVELEVSLRSSAAIEARFIFTVASNSSLKLSPALATESYTSEDSQLAFKLSFNANGHHIIAMLAWHDLQMVSPKAYKVVEAILRNGDRTLQEAATYPDDIRMKQPATRPLHFIDIPLQEGGPSEPELPAPPHVLSKIEEVTAALKSGEGTDSDKVDALSWLIHLFGDLHQPLHCVDRFSDLHPAGDRGGNAFKLRGKAKNLHSLWDSSVNIMTPSRDEELIVTDIMTAYPRSSESISADLESPDPSTWARASFTLAKVHAYGELVEDPTNPPTPSSDYLVNTEKIGQRQAALAGYRLSDRLKDIFG
ncbi:S1/P1 nuclease (plasmid) [Hymenobacter sp. BRD128]|uniref:S1/P1 nuclease n=1 Tax=Hymenobacter sp. BRD128 TaxID=2675878 RepID=UPI0015645762|nr:S1/P1 nuclease [Hymenobacter sp. BRD128]QKG59084.1 S1/P1 nuclease [Hymenobacter sp. BRD128]